MALGRSIELRPQEILTREEFGHYEADTIVSGKGSNSALLTVFIVGKREYRKI